MNQATDRDLGIRIGVAVRRYREQQGWTQAELAQRAQVAQAEISYIELGKRSKLSTLDRVSIALKQRLSDLIRFAEEIGDSESVVSEAREFVLKTRGRQKTAAVKKSAKPRGRFAAS
jgi:transcriptional regulator with XRE-family HTH domain